MNSESFDCYLVRKLGKDKIEASVEKKTPVDLPDGEVLIRVSYSSLNYKDALAATGNPGVAKTFPHVPGIDAAGTVAESRSPDFSPGQQVLVTGYELGAGQWGGWSQLARVPAEWVVPLPDGLTLKEAMILGTAGFTAGMSVEALGRHDIAPDRGEVVVTGATGGVGTLAVKILAKLGYTVVAVSGKAEKHGWLKEQGAARVIGRDEVDDASTRPLLKAQWAGAVDTVGGNMLATILRSTNLGGCVTACGLVGGIDLPLTVFPFILRGVTLSGIDSAWYPRERRIALWNKLAGGWKPDGLEAIAHSIDFSQLDGHVQQILEGKMIGRTIVEVPQ